MNKKFLSIIALCSALSLYGMDDNDNDAQLTVGMATLEIGSAAKVDAWKALSESHRRNMSYVLCLLAQEYDQKEALQDEGAHVIRERWNMKEIDAVTTRACRDLRRDIRDNGAPVPLTEEAYQVYLQPSIAWANAVRGRTIEDISDISLTTDNSEDEDDDDWDETLDEDAMRELILEQIKELSDDSSLEGNEDIREDVQQMQIILNEIIKRTAPPVNNLSETTLKEKLYSAIDRQCAALNIEKTEANKYFDYLLGYAKKNNVNTDDQCDGIVAGILQAAGVTPVGMKWCFTSAQEKQEFQGDNADFEREDL